jgi:hypothetical protein
VRFSGRNKKSDKKAKKKQRVGLMEEETILVPERSLKHQAPPRPSGVWNGFRGITIL